MTFNFNVKIKTGKNTRPTVTVKSTAFKQDQPMPFASGFDTTPKLFADYLAGAIDHYVKNLKR